MHPAGGWVLPPVQKLVASSIFTFGENETRPGHRHQFPHFRKKMGDFVFLSSQNSLRRLFRILLHPRKDLQNGNCGVYLRCKLLVNIYVGGGRDRTVTQPGLNILQPNTVGKQQFLKGGYQRQGAVTGLGFGTIIQLPLYYTSPDLETL